MFGERRLHLGAEGVFVQADNRGAAGMIVNGDDIEAAGAFGDVAFGKKVLGGANDDVLFIAGDAEFGEAGQAVVADGAGADFDEGESVSVVADEIEFAFDGARSVIAGDEDVAIAAEIPVGVGFAADAGTASSEFFFAGGIGDVIAEAAAGGPADGLKHQV